jgi:hypothetical protein
MPVTDGEATRRHRLVRFVRVVRGSMRFVLEIQPRFDYGRTSHTTDVTEHGLVFSTPDLTLTVHRVGPSIAATGDTDDVIKAEGLRLVRTTPTCSTRRCCSCR